MGQKIGELCLGNWFENIHHKVHSFAVFNFFKQLLQKIWIKGVLGVSIVFCLQKFDHLSHFFISRTALKQTLIIFFGLG